VNEDTLYVQSPRRAAPPRFFCVHPVPQVISLSPTRTRCLFIDLLYTCNNVSSFGTLGIFFLVVFAALSLIHVLVVPLTERLQAFELLHGFGIVCTKMVGVELHIGS
jgi:hypothetical protein